MMGGSIGQDSSNYNISNEFFDFDALMAGKINRPEVETDKSAATADGEAEGPAPQP